MAQKRERTEYGQRVYTARTLAKLTQPQLAKAAGMSQGTLGELEYNAHSSRFTAQIATACRVRAEWLATGEGPMRDATMLPPDLAELVSGMDSLQGVQREFVITAAKEAMSAILKLSQEAVVGKPPAIDSHQSKKARTG